jgi:glucosyl-dolichyl phosphate glucuronosyltransferase
MSTSATVPAQPAAPRMSIVIGTLNRADAIGRSIQSVLDQDFPKDRYEILVVDNGCTDGTEQLVRGMSATASNVRYVKEPKLGLSNARNKGIAEAQYELIAFFDDDATAEPGWLTALTDVFRREPDAGAAGGPIIVGWPTQRPNWMPASCEGYFGHCYYGTQRTYLRYPQYPFGSNMVIRKERLLQIGGFNTAVGPKGQNMMSAGEQDLFARLHEHSIKVVYEPAATVYHWVQADRVTRSWVLKRARKHGLSNTRMIGNTQSDAVGAAMTRLLRASFRTGVGLFSATAGWLLRSEPHVVMSRLATAMYWEGITRGTARSIFSRSDR